MIKFVIIEQRQDGIEKMKIKNLKDKTNKI